ncbi:Potassium voltage-gated channel subfamily KQT; possible potassium channel, VIC family [hydrothermal vent metagenome]|uniref:Potassium voltage-gated channel subfamily KQT possible potassium channel, VIC family n=1 Tax=hydrothermal vent metagenome TaxID=652676 RepID=A0A3B0W8S5_9ZZZZ
MPLLKTLKIIVDENSTFAGKAFDIAIQILIVISLVSLSIASFPDLTPSTEQKLQWMEVFFVIVFSAEYLLRIVTADNKLKYIFSFFGIIDLLAILPFYFTQGGDLIALRALRLLLLFKLFRYNAALHRYQHAFVLMKDELILFSGLMLIVLYLAAAGIWYFEHAAQPDHFKSIFHSLWWAIVTLTTVGYGDVYPVTMGGKVFTFILLMIGLGIVAVPTGLLASALATARAENQQQKTTKDRSSNDSGSHTNRE